MVVIESDERVCVNINEDSVDEPSELDVTE
jgi:hypothetical protein